MDDEPHGIVRRGKFLRFGKLIQRFYGPRCRRYYTVDWDRSVALVDGAEVPLSAMRHVGMVKSMPDTRMVVDISLHFDDFYLMNVYGGEEGRMKRIGRAIADRFKVPIVAPTL